MREIGIFFCMWVLCTACQGPKEPIKVMQAPLLVVPEVKAPDRIWQVAFLVMDGVYNTELTAPYDVIQHTLFHVPQGTHMEVFTIADSLTPVRTFEGLRLMPDYSYLDSEYPEIDVLIVPSAEHHLDTDLENEAMIHFVAETGKNAKYVMSLCDGAFVLAQAGLLDGYASTTFPSDIAKYREMFPHLEVYEHVWFVHDQRFITSAGGAKSFEPAMYLVEMLYGKKAAEGIGRGLVIDWDLQTVPALINE